MSEDEESEVDGLVIKGKPLFASRQDKKSKDESR